MLLKSEQLPKPENLLLLRMLAQVPHRKERRKLLEEQRKLKFNPLLLLPPRMMQMMMLTMMLMMNQKKLLLKSLRRESRSLVTKELVFMSQKQIPLEQLLTRPIWSQMLLLPQLPQFLLEQNLLRRKRARKLLVPKMMRPWHRGKRELHKRSMQRKR